MARDIRCEISSAISSTGETLEHGDEFVSAIALLTSQFDDLLEFRCQQALLGSSGHSNAATTTHLHEPLVAKDAQRAQHRVRVHTEFCGEVPRLRNPFTGAGFALGDGSAYLRRHLFMQQCRVATVEGKEAEVRLGIFLGSIDKTHDANYSSFMFSSLDVTQMPGSEQGLGTPAIEVLFREARRRQRQRRIRRTLAGLASFALVGAAVGVAVGSAGSSATKSNATPSAFAGTGAKVLTCSGASVVRPRTLVVSCADANTSLQSIHWATWGAGGASGTTTFAINLCTPYCAASPMSYFPHSSVTLSAPVASRAGTYFSRLEVRYTQGSTVKTFRFAWTPGVSR